ncbi:hypothetical protein [Asticcacaulis sp. AC402]|uniref:hypothetical protein n=1 Tax=Asticcacaulis sp. AC402 TaxID=1282361 RepID=UPI0003C3FEE5|nr:hypothetical protein [Asticcacaulis sp. AC402]ESQ74543.1 hypothetical protein ABAC402_13730 [Asticcacaulis sp. AC402]
MTRLTGSTSYFVEAPGPSSAVIEWFRNLPEPPEETSTEYGFVLYFRSFGPLVYNEKAAIDVSRSPVVTIVLPTLCREILWTVGEVHFLPTLSLPEGKRLQRIVRAFAKWLKGKEKIYDQSPKVVSLLAYYIEGTARNRGDIYALPSGLEHLERGGYVISHRESEFVVDRVCRQLLLRGINCGPADNLR